MSDRSVSPRAQDDRQPLLSKEEGKSSVPHSPESPKSQRRHSSHPHRPRRRLTFSGPPGKPVFHSYHDDDDPHHHEQTYGHEAYDALGQQMDSRSSSIGNIASFHNPVRDLTSYDPRNLPNSKPQQQRTRSSIAAGASGSSGFQTGPRGSVSTRPAWKGDAKSSASTENANPFNKFGSGFNQQPSTSPSFAERWLNRQSQINNYGSTSGGSTGGGSPVKIDMEQFQSPSHDSNGGGGAGAGAGAGNHSHETDSDFDSKPSSRRSSESSSLADVCFPLEPLDDVEGARSWPDLKVLEEFYEEETTRLKDEAIRETNEVNFRFENTPAEDNATSSSIAGESSNAGGVGFSHPIVTKVDAPRLLGNQRINETETLDGGRLRPPKINPWDKRRFNNTDFLKTINYPPQIVNNNPEHFRFTYFRENLDSTVHSPTISGLLQPGQKFSDLFSCEEYTKQDNENFAATGTTGAGTGTNTGANTTNNSNANSVKEPTPTLSELKAIEESLELDDHISPFWLDVLNPTEEEMKVISKAFSIHPLTTEDIFLGETREKVELFKDYYFICFRSFDIVREKAKIRERLNEMKIEAQNKNSGFFSKLFKNRRQSSTQSRNGQLDGLSETSSIKRRTREIELEKFKKKSGDRHKPKGGELEPLNVYILVFRNAVLTFHFAPTPHPVNVRRRARLLREYLTVSADWIAYALIDDITDAFGPMIESIEDEVNAIEDAILRMHPGSSDDEEESSDEEEEFQWNPRSTLSRRDSQFDDKRSVKSFSSSSSRSTASNVIEWKKKGDMLKRIGECRKRVMSLLRLLGSKADVIKGFAKRCNEQWEVAPRSEIGMYLGDIQDHIVTMVQSLNHYEKLLARSHSNYLAQINIDMTRVNNDMNDVLGKISILGTVVLPMNIVTGLWGMNVLVPGQDYEGLAWFWSIAAGMFTFAFCCYIYAKKISGIA